MNAEENRLQTYQTWPENAPVHPSQLAREGFFATENFLETECFCCHKRIENWQYGDSITTRHLLLNPECDFLTNPIDSGNLPMQQHGNATSQQFGVLPTAAVATATTPTPAPLDLTQLDLKIEANRLATFVNWPNPNITPQALAKAGFYYFNRSDQVRCAWCKGVVAKWEKEDNAFEEHQRFFPECPRVLLGPLIEIASDGIRDLGIQQITPPKRPKFSSLDARLRTYTNWPISDIQRPEALAQAGLYYYHDVGDQVRCFHCFIGLRSWQKEDDPWFEHAKWYPQCQFVRLVKGANYVQQVQEMTRQTAAQEPAAETCEDITTPHPPATSIEDAMETTPVLQALEIGIDVGAIRTVTQRRLALTGRPYDTVENLLKAVFGDPDDDSNEEDDDNGYNQYSESERGAVDTISQRIRRLTQIGASTSATGSNVPATVTNCVTTIGNDVPPRSLDTLLISDSVPLNPTCSPTSSNASGSLRVERPKTTITECINNAQQDAESTPHRKISLEEENRKLKDARLCKVCLDEEVGVVFLPCGHLVTCVQCAPGVNQCPMCRTVIKGFVRTFLS